MGNKKKISQLRDKFQTPDLRHTKQDSTVDHDFQWNPVCTVVAIFLPVAVDEGDPGGRNDHYRQSRRRLSFGSDLKWRCKYPLDTGLLWTCSCRALGETSGPVRSKTVSFLTCDHLSRLQEGKVERTWVGSWFDLNLGFPQARVEPYDVHFWDSLSPVRAIVFPHTCTKAEPFRLRRFHFRWRYWILCLPQYQNQAQPVTHCDNDKKSYSGEMQFNPNSLLAENTKIQLKLWVFASTIYLSDVRLITILPSCYCTRDFPFVRNLP